MGRRHLLLAYGKTVLEKTVFEKKSPFFFQISPSPVPLKQQQKTVSKYVLINVAQLTSNILDIMRMIKASEY